MYLSYLIFSDLDGTLLDEDTYDFSEAQDAISFLKRMNIPLILCSSKTREEIELYRSQMGLKKEPFIVENGGAIYIPDEKFNLNGISYQVKHGCRVIELGIPSSFIKKCLDEIRKETAIEVKCLSKMDIDEIVSFSNLPPEQAKLARQREYSEPIVFKGNEEKFNQFKKAIREYKLHLTKGGRFYTLMGGNDKGKAVFLLKTIYQQTYPKGNFITIGFGDSPNDLPLLKTVDRPVVVKKKNGSHMKVDLPNVYFTKFVGPRGWAEAILNLVKEENND